MADCGGDSDVNLNALQRVDPYIVEIVDSATQVALYKFNAQENEWIKTGVEGTLFVYNRSAAPLHGFVIMNRLSKTNQIEPITKDLELQREDPYLLYKNSKLNIFGIWFYGKNDCSKINDSITRLLSKEKDKQKTCQRLRRASESDSMKDEGVQQLQPKSVNILSLLSKAENIYSKNKTIKEESEPKQMMELPSSGTMTSADLIRPKAVRVGGAPDVTRTSPLALKRSGSQEELVKDPLKALFASATKAQPVPVPILDSCLPPTASNSGNNNLIPLVQSNPVLLRLMSNPEHLVEHIERQQRNEVSSQATTSTLQSLEKDLKEKLKLGLASKESIATAPEHVVSPGDPPLKRNSSGESQGILTPAMLKSIMPNLSTMTTPMQSSGVPQMTHVSSFSETVVTPQMFTTPIKLPLLPTPDIALISPMMLMARQLPPKSHASSNGALADPGDLSKTDRSRVEVPTLTKTQMTEAFIYLLQNDAEFGEKLYEGYLKQCTEKRA